MNGLPTLESEQVNLRQVTRYVTTDSLLYHSLGFPLKRNIEISKESTHEESKETFVL